MSTEQKNVMKKWIALNDQNGAQLKVGVYKNKLILVITGVRPRSSMFYRTVNELGFTPSGKGSYLVKACDFSDRVYPSQFHAIWPDAKVEPMLQDSYTLDLEGARAKQQKKMEREANRNAESVPPTEREAIQETITDVLNRSTYLGRNKVGDRVFNSLSGRFYVTADESLVYDSRDLAGPLFLKGATQTEVRDCAKGLLKAADKGESQNKASLMTFAGTVLQKPADEVTHAERQLVAQAIDSALLESLVENNPTAGNAWADASYYQEMMPGRSEFVMDSAEAPYLPAPIAVQIQRFLSSADVVSVSGKIPGFGFGLLPENTQVYVDDPDTLEWGNQSYHRPSVESFNKQDAPADGGYWRLSGPKTQSEISEFFDRVSDEGICVITAGSLDHLPDLQERATLVQAIKVPHYLSNTEKPIYLFVMKKGEIPKSDDDDEDNLRVVTPSQISGWNDLKSLVDESLLRLGKEAEANEEIAEHTERTENRYQRPYLAFSKVGQASTMVPKNLQSGLGYALSRLEEINGPIDQFVADELGIGRETMGDHFSPEQVDAIGLIINRIQSGRGFILGDETGIGKGRSIAAVATWANKIGKKIIFVTDRSNLFSDLARDLIDIGEWERFRPLITNADGKILHIMGDAEELAKPATPGEMKRLLTNPEESNANIIFTTYSQINQADSEKGKWLLNQVGDALVIADEAHVAAGSDSNIAKQLQTMVDQSWGVLYSSATWAKSSKNLHIYARALPESVNISQVISAMKEDGESFGEVFSSMLAMDGAFVRREHDLSKIDFVVEVDTEHRERNVQVAGQVSEILGMMAMVSGEINHMLQRLNTPVRNALMAAREARQVIASQSNLVIQNVGAARSQIEADIVSGRVRMSVLNQTIDAQERIGAPLDQPLTIEFDDPAQVLTFITEFENPTRIGPTSPLETYQYNLAKMHQERTNLEASIPLLVTEFRSLPSAADDALEHIPTKLFTSSFGTGGAIYQVMRRSLAALSVDHTADKAIRAHQEGRRPVIVFEETGESFVNQFITEEQKRIIEAVKELNSRMPVGELSEVDAATREIADLLESGIKSFDLVQEVRIPTLKDMMRNLLHRLGGVKIEESRLNELGDPVAQNSEDPAELVSVINSPRLTDIPGVDRETIERYMEGIAAITTKINAMPDLPIVPVDALRARFERAGLSVGEISGRKFQLNPRNPESLTDGLCRLVKRERKKSDVTKAVKKFNSGHTNVLIINKSAATGLSIHASPRFEDSKQRELFEMQSDENPTNRIQLFGRVNRFDQVVPPRISIMTTGLRGEMRTIMMQNKKLTSLSANIRSSRENAALIEDVPDLLNRTGDKVCQEYLLENPGIAGRLDIPMSRIKDGYSLSQMMTQRIALLSPKDQDKVYEDLTISYEDALLENAMSSDTDAIAVRDWRAHMVSQKHAWGPTRNLESLSAFDSPVFQREVEFEQNYQPFHWQEVRDQIAASTTRLMGDQRMRTHRAVSMEKCQWDKLIYDMQLNREKLTSTQEKHNQWTLDILISFSEYLSGDSLGVEVKATSEAGLSQDGEQNEDEDNDEQESSNDNDYELTPSNIKHKKHIPKGFASLSGSWAGVEARIPGTNVNQRLMALVSRSGKTAKLWFLNEKNEARTFLMDLDRAIQNHDKQPGAALKEVETLKEISDNHWIRSRFNQVWGSSDPGILLVDTSNCTNIACTVLDAKIAIALPQTGFASFEEAMASGEHNAVKEAVSRRAFMEKVIPHLTPGTLITVSSEENNTRFGGYFNLRRMVLIDVKIPPSGQESVLSRWKFYFANPGEEKSTVLSGAFLLKIAGAAPHFNLLQIGDNVYENKRSELNRAKEDFNRYRKGIVTRRKTLLVGNPFQAGEWARDSKRGQPIIYTDETGQRHRAIDVQRSIFAMGDMSFPLRLHNREMIKDFFKEVFPADLTSTFDEDGNEVEPANRRFPDVFTVYTSFKGALLSQQREHGIPDTMLIDAKKGLIGWMVDKDEKEKVRRNLRNATNADKRHWEADHPGVSYPVVWKADTKRGSGANSQTLLSIALPQTQEGRDRFLDIFIKTQGLQLFTVGRHSYAYVSAKRAEQRHYDRLAQPALEERTRLEEVRQRRRSHREMLANAFEDEAKVENLPSVETTSEEKVEIVTNQNLMVTDTNQRQLNDTDGFSLTAPNVSEHSDTIYSRHPLTGSQQDQVMGPFAPPYPR